MNDPLRIIIDSREQTPWAFPPELATCRVQCLSAGDYALEDDPGFAIERKNLDDFAGTISSGWQRFNRELARMENFAAKVIIVEGLLIDCCFYEHEEELVPPQHNHFMVTPQFILKQIGGLTMENVSVLFAGTADIAAGLAYAILKERAERLDKERKENADSSEN